VKFCSFSAGGVKRFGIIPEQGTYIDLKSAVSFLAEKGDPLFNGLNNAFTLKQWFELENSEFGVSQKIVDIFCEDRERLGDCLFFSRDIRLLAPIDSPGKIMAIGLNYRDHAEEQGVPLPENPRMFAKFPSAVIGPEEPVKIPGISKKVDPEAELCLVVTCGGKNMDQDQARRSVAFMAGNDVSARDLQFADVQWVRGKSCDTFAPCGPYIVTLDEVGDPHDLKIELRRNGEVKQSSSTSRLIFNCWELVEFISRTATLFPGDIIFTGTPSGVGVFRDPPEFLAPGDVVEVTIEKLGTLRNPVVRA
jgi:2-keto-4-pentenoate hydratase/2-oxohepta-3-ene-1,7-dioic acid hydratase in catechol pathway